MTLTKAGRPSEARDGRRFIQAGGLIFYLLALQGLGTFGVGLQIFLSGGNGRDLMLPATGAILAVCYAVVGYNLRRYRLWARNFAFAFAAVSVFAFPVGTVLGSLIVVLIDRANRAGVFPSRPRPAAAFAEAEPETPLLRFDPAPVPAAAE